MPEGRMEDSLVIGCVLAQFDGEALVIIKIDGWRGVALEVWEEILTKLHLSKMPALGEMYQRAILN